MPQCGVEILRGSEIQPGTVEQWSNLRLNDHEHLLLLFYYIYQLMSY